MREIEFRAWDPEHKKMQDIDGVVDGVAFRFTTIGNGDFETHNDWVLMQYTGLEDKNGKEIYEGDVVKLLRTWEDVPLYHFEDGNKIVVEFSNGAFYPFADNDDGMPYPQPEKCEVIGNIYENPGLLT